MKSHPIPPLRNQQHTYRRVPKALRHAVLLAIGTATALSSARAVDGSWNINASGNWNTATNWTSNPTVPGGAGSTVGLTFNITGDRVVTIDTTSTTVGILNIGDPNGSNRYTLNASGGAGLIFDNGASVAQLNNLNGSATPNLISLPISLASSLNVANSASTQLTLDSTATVSASTAGTKTITNAGSGSGIVQLSGVISNGAGTVGIVQNSSTSELRLSGANTFTGGVTVRAGTVVLTNSNSAAGTGLITLGDTSGSAGAAIRTQGRTISNAINLGGTSGTLILGTSISGAGTFTGDISGNNNLVLDTATGGALNVGNASTQINHVGTLTNASTSAGAVSVAGIVMSNVTGVTQNSATSTMTLSSNSNAYIGTTLISSGTLVANANKALGNSSLNINGGALDVRGGTAGSVTLGTNSSFAFSDGDVRLQLGTNFDTVISSGNGAFTITGGEFVLDVTGAGFNYANTYAVLQGFGGLNSVSGLTFSGYDTVNYVANLDTNGVLSFTAIPEPGASLLFGLGLGFMLLLRRRSPRY